ncbi:MAG: YkgJ family cysteine cluster protein [Lachnospiraceae bacterium]|nr:YkgJ family cysteine cluster protein [Lachnospiraceae bacterium]
MKRNIDLKEISDGRLYEEKDMVRAGCNDCKGCFACCTGMGESIVLDPLDMYRLTCGAGFSIEELFGQYLELHVVDGLTLPNLRMRTTTEQVSQTAGTGIIPQESKEQEQREGRCSFLNAQGRCSIHPHRPGICRIFPLGRVYEDGDFKYFLQKGECKSAIHTKVKVDKWIAVDNVRANHEFLNTWHYFLNDLEERVGNLEDMELARRLNLLLLQTFYLTPYDASADFYRQFKQRRDSFLQLLG